MTNVLKDVGRKGRWWECKLVQTMEISLYVLQQTKNSHLYHFWAYIQRNQSHHTIVTSISVMFIATLLTMVKLWNQTRCPSTDGWIENVISEYYNYNEVLFNH